MLEVKPFSKARSIREWYIERESLDLSPSYQRRGDLWPLHYKQLLINSVLNQFDVPKFYVADFTYIDSKLNERKTPYAVIDGKQRLLAFFEFFDNGFRLGDTPIQLGSEVVTLARLHYSDLRIKHPKLARRYDDFAPTVMSVIADSFEDIQELFIRLNLSVSISGPERRNAMAGPLPPLIRALSVHEFFRKRAIFPINRGQDLNLSAKLLLMEVLDGFTTTKKKDLDHFVVAARKHPRSRYVSQHRQTEETLSTMVDVFREKDPLLARQAQLPAYYWLVRNASPITRRAIRGILEQFESERLQARTVMRERARGAGIPAPSDTLIQYNTVVRSPDDKASQEFMYETLVNRLKEAVAHRRNP
jgi:hypothetical protein